MPSLCPGALGTQLFSLPDINSPKARLSLMLPLRASTGQVPEEELRKHQAEDREMS